MRYPNACPAEGPDKSVKKSLRAACSPAPAPCSPPLPPAPAAAAAALCPATANASAVLLRFSMAARSVSRSRPLTIREPDEPPIGAGIGDRAGDAPAAAVLIGAPLSAMAAATEGAALMPGTPADEEGPSAAAALAEPLVRSKGGGRSGSGSIRRSDSTPISARCTAIYVRSNSPFRASPARTPHHTTHTYAQTNGQPDPWRSAVSEA
jgi:hypothetical protein